MSLRKLTASDSRPPVSRNNIRMSTQESDSLFVPEESPPMAEYAVAPTLRDARATPHDEDVDETVLSPQAFEADRSQDSGVVTGAEEIHDPTQELLPEHPYFGLDVPALHSDIDAALRDLWIALQGFEDDDTEMANQRQVTQQGRDVGAPKPLVVTTVGPAGVGKSFLYKALFNRPNITKSSAEGRSCTLYPTRIMLKPEAADDTTVSDIDVELFDAATIATMTESHVKSYYDYHYSQDSDPMDDDNRRHAATAMEFFEVALNTANDNESIPVLQALLAPDMITNGELLRVCTEAIEERISSLDALRERKFSSLAVEDDQIDHMRKVADSMAPIVNFFVIKTGATLLRAGLTFIDLPGKCYRCR